MRKWGMLYGAVTLVALSACSASGDKPEKEAGSLSLALRGSDSRGDVYRLRNAAFVINGYYDYYYYQSSWGGAPSDYYYEEVSTEADPDSPSIERRVLSGYYNVSLQNNDWYLERVTSSGAERVEQAVLLSQRDVGTYVYPHSTSPVAFRFGVDGDLIDFRGGELSVRIDIERPEDTGSSGGFGGQGFGGTSSGGSPFSSGGAIAVGGAAN